MIRDRRMPRHLAVDCAPWNALVFYVACTCAVFWPVLRDATDAFPHDLGDPPSQAWIIAWYTHTLLSAPAQLWDANIFYPARGVFAYQDSLLGLAPLAMPLLLLSGNLPLTYNVLFLLSFVLCGWFAFLFVRYLLRVAAGASVTPYSSGAAVLGGVIYAFLPFKMSHLGHLNLLSSEWLPLIFLFWERGWRGSGRRSWAGLGLSFLLQALSSLYYAIFAGLGLLLLLALRLWRREHGQRVPWRPLGVTALAAGATLLPVLLPYIHTVRLLGHTRPLGEVVGLSPDLRDLLHSSPQSYLYGWTDRLFPPHAIYSPQYLFLGIVPLLLGLVGVLALRRQRPARGESKHADGTRMDTKSGAAARAALRPYLLLGVAAIVLALGPFIRVGSSIPLLPGPYLILYWLVPGFQGLRDPGRLMMVAGLCLALLAAWGAASLMGRLQTEAGRRRGWLPGRVAWAALWALVLLEYAAGPVPMPRVAVEATIPPVYRWLARQPASTAVLELPIGLDTQTIWSQQGLMMYYSTYHWRRIINGTGGFAPPWYDQLSPVLASFPLPASLHLLHRWGIHYVIVHGAWTGAAVAQRIAHEAAAYQVTSTGQFGDDTVYQL